MKPFFYDITGMVGGNQSMLGNMAIGHDMDDEVLVTFIGMKDGDENIDGFIYGVDEGGFPLILKRNRPTILKKSQAHQAVLDGALLLMSS